MSEIIALARKAAELGIKTEAQKAYRAVIADWEKKNKDLNEGNDLCEDSRKTTADLLKMTVLSPEYSLYQEVALEILEASYYLYASGYDPVFCYGYFFKLINAGLYKNELMPLLYDNLLAPDIIRAKDLYEKNCRLLLNYPYIFKESYPEFDMLDIRFFPLNEGYVRYKISLKAVLDYVIPNKQCVDRYFFEDLSKPIFTSGLYSQYQLEYLNDNVRESELCGRENHIYLHYDSFEEFCSWLQVIDLSQLIMDKKCVFLFGEEKERYPIDFKKEFGIDYSLYDPKPYRIREIKKLILHGQLSSHNGGDFFNEIFHGHPNILYEFSEMWNDLIKEIMKLDSFLKDYRSADKRLQNSADRYAKKKGLPVSLIKDYISIKDPGEKDLFVFIYLMRRWNDPYLNLSDRIIPAIFFQPHFGTMDFSFEIKYQGGAEVIARETDMIKKARFIKDFKYIKTFMPMRRMTTSYAAAVRFADMFSIKEQKSGSSKVLSKTDADKKSATEEDDQTEKLELPTRMGDHIIGRLLNRNYLRDQSDPIFMDSRLVRFEDSKLNPEATFRALARFLDLPYTESMTRCTNDYEENPESFRGNVRGFDTVSVYKTYPEFANDAERKYIEYLAAPFYRKYGYDFQYISGDETPEEAMADIRELVDQFDIIDSYVDEFCEKLTLDLGKVIVPDLKDDADWDMIRPEIARQTKENYKKNRLLAAEAILGGFHPTGKDGKPMVFIEMLKPIKELEQVEPYR